MLLQYSVGIPLHWLPAEALYPPVAAWMCGRCVVPAERRGEAMMQHGLEGEDDVADGAGFDSSAVDTEDG